MIDRHADRRVHGDAASTSCTTSDRRCNPAIDLGPDRGRLHPGHGLADDRGAVVGRQGPPRGPMPPAPTRSPPAATGRRTSASSSWTGGRIARRRSTAQGRGRAAADAGHLRVPALSDAVASLADYRLLPALDAPATPERVLMAIEDIAAARWRVDLRRQPVPWRPSRRVCSGSTQALDALSRGERCVLVTVAAGEGLRHRESRAPRCWCGRSGTAGSVGGGRLESRRHRRSPIACWRPATAALRLIEIVFAGSRPESVLRRSGQPAVRVVG